LRVRGRGSSGGRDSPDGSWLEPGLGGRQCGTMAETLARWLLEIAAIYAMAGLAFAIPFVTGWVGRLDASARMGSWGFRLLIVPGVIGLWPVLAGKVWRIRQGRYVPPVAERPVPPARLRRIHGWSFRALAVLVPLVCAAALITRCLLYTSLAAGGFVLLALALLGPDWRTRRRTGVAQFLCFGAMMGAFLGFLGLGSRSKRVSHYPCLLYTSRCV